MIEKLYKKYFQKSKSFLFPALGIKKRSYATPIETYISIEGMIQPEDFKLICCYNKDDSEKYKEFEEAMLITNPLFVEKMEMDDINIYVFDLDIYQSDFFNFLLGRYSKLSNILKKTIKGHFGEKSGEYAYIETYLYPDKYYETYAKLLDIDVNTIKSSGELCDAYDVDRETLKISSENLLVLNKTI